MVTGVQVAPKLEQKLDKLARNMGKSRSAYLHKAISQYLQCFSDND